MHFMTTQEAGRHIDIGNKDNQPFKEDFAKAHGITLFELNLSSGVMLRAEAVYVKTVFRAPINFPINVTDSFAQISEITLSVPSTEALSDDHGIRLLSGVYLVDADGKRVVDEKGPYAYHDEVKKVNLIRLYKIFRLFGYLANQPGFKLADINRVKMALDPNSFSGRLGKILSHHKETSCKPSVVPSHTNGSHLHFARTLTEAKEYLGLPAPLELDDATRKLEAAGMPFYVAQ